LPHTQILELTAFLEFEVPRELKSSQLSLWGDPKEFFHLAEKCRRCLSPFDSEDGDDVCNACKFDYDSVDNGNGRF